MVFPDVICEAGVFVRFRSFKALFMCIRLVVLQSLQCGRSVMPAIRYLAGGDLLVTSTLHVLSQLRSRNNLNHLGEVILGLCAGCVNFVFNISMEEATPVPRQACQAAQTKACVVEEEDRHR